MSTKTIDQAGWRFHLPVLAVAAQLALITWVVYHFRLENPHFLRLLMLVGGGFLLHAALPQQYRLRFFLVLSLIAISMVLGPKHAIALVLVGGGLIALCHLPVPWIWRYAAVLAAGCVLALARAQVIELTRSEPFWQILGSMFMFRLVLYLYDLRHSKQGPTPTWSLAYFFLLPNVCFPLFPVVDFQRFRKSHYSDDATRIYQRGVTWMFRGVYQLLLYRFVYHFMAIDPAEVDGASQLLLFIFSAFPLYLRVSGHFHLIVGILLLFGFNLPTTHNRYFLASSLTELWRRINIYWKDFMMKIVFYPTYDKLRGLQATRALAFATAVVFFWTWLLHSYQWFWITGSWLFSWNDTLFWAILGALVVANTVYESLHGKKRTFGSQRLTAAERLARGLRTVCTFIVVCVLWSMWTSDSLDQWLEMMATAPLVGWSLLAVVAALFAGAYLVEAWGRGNASPERTVRRPSSAAAHQPWWRPTVTLAAGALALLAVGQPTVYGRLGTQTIEIAETLRFSGLNQRTARAQDQGYYEELIAANRRNSAFNEGYTWVPTDWKGIQVSEAWSNRDDMLLGEMLASRKIVFKRVPLETNRWGMRDRDYTREKPAGAQRLAILGSSHVMGGGVLGEETFEARYEEHLNRTTPEAFEVLNFAVGSYRTPQHLLLLERKVLSFEPDAVLYIAHGKDAFHMAYYLSKVLARQTPILYPWLEEIVDRSGANEASSREVNIQRLTPYRWELLDQSYRHLVRVCEENGVEPVWVFLPLLWRVDEKEDQAGIQQLFQLARDAGFHIVDLSGVFQGHTPMELRLAPWDDHLNAIAHDLVAERLHEVLGPEQLSEILEPGPLQEVAAGAREE